MANNNAIRTLEDQQKALRQRNESVPVPQGIVFNGPEEKLLWNQITRARPVDEWRTVDLLLVAKIVILEIQIREQEGLLEEEGVILKSNKNWPMENPRFRVLNQMQSRQLTIVRALALNTTGDTAIKKDAKSKKTETVTDALGDSTDTVMSLLAAGG